MRIIFLDFDGVITTELSKFKIDPKRIILLNKLILRTGAKVVVSSLWRYRPTPIVALQLDLSLYGFIGEIIDVTNMNHEDRGKEIDDWVDTHEVDSYVVFDDLDYDILPYKCAQFLVKTNSKYGLRKEHINTAQKILLCS